MFKVGDKVLYPMHGAGIIEAIEEREIEGQRQAYYVMRLIIGDVKVMIPMQAAQDVGLRAVVDGSTVEKVFAVLAGETGYTNGNWNRRYRANLEKIRQGDVCKVAEVVRDLARRDRLKGLSTGERKMLEAAWDILVSELALAQDASQDQIRDELERRLA